MSKEGEDRIHKEPMAHIPPVQDSASQAEDVASPGRGREDRGRSPGFQSYRNRSRSRDRSSSRGNQRSSNSTHYNSNRQENRRSYGEEKRTEGWR